jgi:uncharacterized protein YbjT (DUF2867 family)
MNEQIAVVIGATGLIGNFLVEELLKNDVFSIVKTLTRRPMKLIHPKLQQEIVNFNDLNDFKQKLGTGHTIFCCIGTTQKKVKGDKEAYKKVDFDIPVNAAQIGIEKGFKKYLLVSAIGANENSSNFYLQLKGKTENSIKKLPFQSISIFRPGQLLGKRNEKRMGERILQPVTRILSYFLFGSLKKYRSINARDVAKAMVKQSKQNSQGVHYFEYDQMINLIK